MCWNYSLPVSNLLNLTTQLKNMLLRLNHVRTRHQEKGIGTLRMIELITLGWKVKICYLKFVIKRAFLLIHVKWKNLWGVSSNLFLFFFGPWAWSWGLILWKGCQGLGYYIVRGDLFFCRKGLVCIFNQTFPQRTPQKFRASSNVLYYIRNCVFTL